jgi:endonuclease/exonuclease/phosphatase family metal-dependent hydrolase
MAANHRNFAWRFFIVTDFIIVLLFILASCNSFLHPGTWWFIAILGLVFPFLLMLVIFFFVLCLFFRSRWALFSLAALLFGYKDIRALTGFHFGAGFNMAKSENSIRVLTWNVNWFEERSKGKNGENHPRRSMLEFLRKQDADIMCFQEFLEPVSGPYSNVKDIIALNYPYYYRVTDYGRRSNYRVGVAIFSRFPITDSIQIKYPGPETLRAAESLIACDINIKGTTIRVFTTHLQSVLLQKKDYRDLEIIRNADDSTIGASKSIVKKLKRGYASRAVQADIVRNQADSSKYPEIICGDFNDVPDSYAYFHIKGDRQDAFIAKGSGIGRTFTNISPTLRIDYILPDQQFKVLQCKRLLAPWSDHYPVMADLQISDAK